MWLRMWSVAIYDLRLAERQFWDCTPRQLRALLDRREVELERNEYMIAQLTAVVKNYSFREIETPARPRDFMISDRPARKRRASREAERQRTATNFRAFFRAYDETRNK